MVKVRCCLAGKYGCWRNGEEPVGRGCGGRLECASRFLPPTQSRPCEGPCPREGVSVEKDAFHGNNGDLPLPSTLADVTKLLGTLVLGSTGFPWTAKVGVHGEAEYLSNVPLLRDSTLRMTKDAVASV